MHDDSVTFHNVAELRQVEGYDGRVIQRLPEDVRVELNEGAKVNYRRPAGSEIRFVAEGGATVWLSCPDGECGVRQFWGPFQGQETTIGPEPTAVEIERPKHLVNLRPEVAQTFPFHPRVSRVLLPHQSMAVSYHGVDGDIRSPRESELPDTRYLAYGTSITRGIAATEPHLTFVNQVAQQTGFDAINMGSAGSAFCERAVADHMAQRDDWDVATLAISVNMVAGFAPAEFERRAEYMVETIAAENPDSPVVCITLFPYFPDLCTDPDGHENFEQFREVLRSIVAGTQHDNVRLLEGPDLLDDVGGLTVDLVHPGDRGMNAIALNLAEELESVLED